MSGLDFISSHPAPWPGTADVGPYADAFGGKADIPIPMSGLRSKADALADPSECLPVAHNGRRMCLAARKRLLRDLKEQFDIV